MCNVSLSPLLSYWTQICSGSRLVYSLGHFTRMTRSRNINFSLILKILLYKLDLSSSKPPRCAEKGPNIPQDSPLRVICLRYGTGERAARHTRMTITKATTGCIDFVAASKCIQACRQWYSQALRTASATGINHSNSHWTSPSCTK